MMINAKIALRIVSPSQSNLAGSAYQAPRSWNFRQSSLLRRADLHQVAVG